MATYTPEQFAGRLLAVKLAVDRVPIEGVTAGAELVKGSIMALAPSFLSGVGKKGAKIGVKVRVSSSGVGGGAQATVSATGPFQLIERDTQEHSEPRRHRGGPRRYVAISGEGVFSHVDHPGTKGKHPFERGVLRAQPLVTKLFDLKISTTINALI